MRPDLSSDLGAPDMTGDMMGDMATDMSDDLDAALDQEADLPIAEDMEQDMAELRCPYGERDCGGACAPYPRAVGMEAPTCASGRWTAGACRGGYTFSAADNVCVAQPPASGEVGPDLGAGPHVIDGVLDGFGRIHLVVGGPMKTRYAVWDGGVERWKVRDLPHKGRAVAISVGYSGDAHIILQDGTSVRYFVMTAEGTTNARGLFAEGLDPSGAADVAIAAYGGLNERAVGAWLDSGGKINIKRTSPFKNLLNAETGYKRLTPSTELELVLESDDDELIFSIDKESGGVSRVVAQRAGDPEVKVLWESAMGATLVRSLHAINKSALTVGMLVDGTSYVSEPNSADTNALPAGMRPITGGTINLAPDSAIQVADITPPDQLAYLLDSDMSPILKSAWRMSTWAVKPLLDEQIKGLRVFGDKNARWAAFTQSSATDNALHVFKLPPPLR
jgi:hypothetical protein